MSVITCKRKGVLDLSNINTSNILSIPNNELALVQNSNVDPLSNDHEMTWAKMHAAQNIGRPISSIENTIKAGSAFDVVQPCFTLKKNMTVRDMINHGIFSVENSANTLPEDWRTMWDALRIDISVRRVAQGTVRQLIYNVINMPNSDRIFSIDEFLPYAVIFEEHNGSGQAVKQGEALLGKTDTATHKIYAAGFEWDLLSALFNKSQDPQKVVDAVVLGSTLLQDDLAIGPILSYPYAPTAKTAASTEGTNRQELLYNTLVDAIDDFGKREDPITKSQIATSDLILLTSSYEANHIMQVMDGLPSTNERVYRSLSNISRVISYDTEVITGRTSANTATYQGVGQQKSYLIKKNRYFNIGIKRPLVMQVDLQPDVRTLAQERRAWYFAEAIKNDTGLPYFVQEISHPAW